jgi:hypothetical protein
MIIKTINREETLTLKCILDDYATHIHFSQQGNDSNLGQKVIPSCLKTIIGLYRVQLYDCKNCLISSKYYLFCPDIFEGDLSDTGQSWKFDLKGSEQGRKKASASTVFKDLDLLKILRNTSSDLHGHNRCNSRLFDIGESEKNGLIQTLEKDCQFLQKHNIIDYSLLIEIVESSKKSNLEQDRR